MALNFNRFSINSQQCVKKCDFDRQFLSHSYLLKFFFKFNNNSGNQKLKAWTFQLGKNYFCMLNIERPIAHQSSNTFFLISQASTYQSFSCPTSRYRSFGCQTPTYMSFAVELLYISPLLSNSYI